MGHLGVGPRGDHRGLIVEQRPWRLREDVEVVCPVVDRVPAQAGLAAPDRDGVSAGALALDNEEAVVVVRDRRSPYQAPVALGRIAGVRQQTGYVVIVRNRR